MHSNVGANDDNRAVVETLVAQKNAITSDIVDNTQALAADALRETARQSSQVTLTPTPKLCHKEVYRLFSTSLPPSPIYRLSKFESASRTHRAIREMSWEKFCVSADAKALVFEFTSPGAVLFLFRGIIYCRGLISPDCISTPIIPHCSLS